MGLPILPSPPILLHRWDRKSFTHLVHFYSPIIFVGDLPCLPLRPIQRGVIFNLGEGVSNVGFFKFELEVVTPGGVH